MNQTFTPPLDGLLVLDMSLFLAGPFAASRLRDLGARVIKVERPDGGDPSRSLYKAPDAENSILFHAINRGKESIALDLKDPGDRDVLMRLVERADVLIQNYRPGVAERLGFGYDAVSKINPGIVYAGISGYGAEGAWAHLPGQDLLAQARSGIMWLTGNRDDAPTPTGLAMADIYAGVTVVQGILAALLGRVATGRGRQIETSLLEGLVDMQFEQLTDYLNNGRQAAARSEIGNANAYAPAPYGVYATRDGHLVIAMTALDRLADLLHTPAIHDLIVDPASPSKNRDPIMRVLADRLVEETSAHWLAILEPASVWCAEVLNWAALLDSAQGKILDMVQTVEAVDGATIQTTRLPMLIDGQRPTCEHAGPSLDAHGAAIRAELDLETKCSPAGGRVGL